jgi:acetyl esterase/lipase
MDVCLRRGDLLRRASSYLDGEDPATISGSHMFADMRSVPPLLIVVGGDEILLDDAVALTRGAANARVDATLHVGAGMQHLFPQYAGAMPEATLAVQRIGRWVKEVTHAGETCEELATFDPD